MTNEEILKKAIEKTEKNGYKYSKTFNKIKFDNYFCRWIVYYVKDNRITWEPIDIYYVLFSQAFAKAFWKKSKRIVLTDEWYKLYEPEDEYVAVCFKGEVWQYHLQQMVLEKEPLKYLEKFL